MRYNEIGMRKVLSSFIIVVFSFLFISVSPTLAKVVANQDAVFTVSQSEVINDDLFVSAKVVQVDGVVNGDVFAGAETVNISGVINGSLHIGAGILNLSGVVKGNIYVGAGNVKITQLNAGGSIVAGSGDFSIDKASVVGGSIIVGAGNASIDSVVKRNVIMGAGNAVIGPNTKIAKDLYYAIGDERQELIIPSSATISGAVHKSVSNFDSRRAEAVKQEVISAVKAARISAAIGGFLGALLVGYLYLYFFKNHFFGSSELVGKHFWKSLGVGLMVSILALPTFIILLMTIVGIPLAGILFLILLVYLYLAKIVVGFALGKWITEKLNWTGISVFLTFAFGLIIIYILKFIPVVSALTGLAVLWSGLGALVIMFTSKSE